MKEKRLKNKVYFRKIIFLSIIFVIISASVFVRIYLKRNYSDRYFNDNEIDHVQNIKTVYYDNDSAFEYFIMTDESGVDYVMTSTYKGKEKCVVVPDRIQDIPVTCIGEMTFLYLDDIERIELPDSITKICNFAFGSCNHLKYICIPESVEEIEENAIAYGDETMRDVIIITNKDSIAEKYAQKKRMKTENF